MAGGTLILDYLAEIDEAAGTLTGDLETLGSQLRVCVARAREVTQWMLETQKEAPQDVLGGASPFLRLMGSVVGGYYLARSAAVAAAKLEAGGGDEDFLKAKVVTAKFYGDNILMPSLGLVSAIKAGAEDLYALSAEALAR